MAAARGVRKRRILVKSVREPEAGMWSNCFVIGDQFYVSGQVSRDETGRLVGPGDPLAQSIQALTNLKSFVEEAGASMDDIIRITVYLTEIRFRPAFIEARRKFFRG